MRKLLLAAFALLALCGQGWAQGIGAPNPILCNQATQSAVAQSIATAIVGRNIVVCGWDVNGTTTAAAFQLVYGTGVACAANTVNIVNWSGLPVGTFIDHGTYAFTSAPTTNAAATPPNTQTNLCVITATNVTYTIYWGQF